MLQVRTKRFAIPAAGIYVGMLVDVRDLGLVASGKFEPREVVELTFQLNEPDPEADLARFIVTQRVTNSLNEKSKLAPIVEALLARPLTGQERYTLDLHTLLDLSCQLVITHQVSKSSGGIFPHIEAATPLGKGMDPLIPDGGYIRQESFLSVQPSSKSA